MVHELAYGKIIDIAPDGMATIKAQLPNLDRAITRKYEDVEILLNDGRHISSEQRRKIFSIIGEITEYIEGFRNAGTIEETKEQMKWSFVLERMEAQERRLFSLANCSMSVASAFIDYLINFVIKNDIPTNINLLEHAEDITKYVYACLVNKKCCICGQAADLHHVEGSRIGQGSDRNEVHHLGRECLPLCRVHHAEAHQGEADFISRYHLEPVKIDDKICKIFKLKK